MKVRSIVLVLCDDSCPDPQNSTNNLTYLLGSTDERR